MSRDAGGTPGRWRSRDIRGVYQVKLPAQRDNDMAVAFAGAQIHAEHKTRLPASAARRGPGPAAASPALAPEDYLEYPPQSWLGGAPGMMTMRCRGQRAHKKAAPYPPPDMAILVLRLVVAGAARGA